MRMVSGRIYVRLNRLMMYGAVGLLLAAFSFAMAATAQADGDEDACEGF